MQRPSLKLLLLPLPHSQKQARTQLLVLPWLQVLPGLALRSTVQRPYLLFHAETLVPQALKALQELIALLLDHRALQALKDLKELIALSLVLKALKALQELIALLLDHRALQALKALKALRVLQELIVLLLDLKDLQAQQGAMLPLLQPT